MSLVSIVVPMRNAEAFITPALSSLLQAQSVSLEVLVVNDGSTDRSLEKVHALQDTRIHTLESQARNAAATFNIGLAAAQGEIIMRCDADDCYPPQRIQQQVSWLLAHPEFGAVCGRFATIDPSGAIVSTLETGNEAEEITQELCQGKVRTHLGTFAIRTAILRQLGGSRPYFVTCDDIDLQLRLGEVCRVWYQPEIRYYYRLHDTSLTHTHTRKACEQCEAIARQLQQQRLARGQDDLQRGKPLPPPDFIPIAGQQSAIAHIQDQLIGQAWREHQTGQKKAALKTGWRCLSLNPWRWDYWRSLLALLLKPAGRF